jgi:hypothetical protein
VGPDPSGLPRRVGALLRLSAVAAAGLLGGMLAAAIVTPRPSPESLLRQALPTPGPERATVLLVFRPDECPGTMRVVRQLNRLQRTEGIAVLGILAADPSRLARWHDLIRAAGIDFPVVRRNGRFLGELASGLSVRQSPLIVVLGKERRVIAAGSAAERRMSAVLDSLPEWTERL